MITQAIDLSLIPGGVCPIIHVSENDAGSRTLTFNMAEDVSGTVTIEGKRSDNEGFNEECSLSDNVVTVDITDDMTGANGDAICNLCFVDDSEVIRTQNFILRVQRRPQ